MYLFVDRSRGLEPVPSALLETFGEPQPVMVFKLEPGRKLARADVSEVISNIEAQGFYLQMPPTAAELLSRDSTCD
jgi:uncharacterized protein YcgL (UPF0745 family)